MFRHPHSTDLPDRRPAGRFLAFLAAAALLVWTGAAGTAPASQRPAAAFQDAAEAKPSQFIRFEDKPGGGGVLQTNIVPYVNDEGVRVDLIGAVHVGDHAYYELLNERFRQYDSLLYEMVKPSEAEGVRRDAGPGLGLIGTLQQAMKTILELEYQLSAVDYRAENFVHADMDLETFTRRQQEKGEGFLEMMIRQMLNDMTRPVDPDHQPPSLVEIMDALAAPDRARRLKLLFAEELSRPEQMMKLFGEESVILDERNDAAFEVLDERIEAGDRRLGIFYGAAHLPDMEEMLRERGFHREGEIEWLTAWDMTLDGSGREEMKERLRQSIVAAARERGEAGAVAPAGDAGEEAQLRRLLAATKKENASLRGEIEVLRDQIESLRAQVEALREDHEEEPG